MTRWPSKLEGGAGDDTLHGGTGNDQLIGGQHDGYWGTYEGPGNDTYRFNLGDGQDVIYDHDTSAASLDAVMFGPGIAPDQVTASRSANGHLVLTIAGSSDQLTVHNYFLGDATAGWQVEEIRFADHPATVWTVADVKAMQFNSGAGNDNLIGYASDDVMFGYEGNDTLSGGAGNDVLDGGAGTDTLSGDAGHDTLYGGAGVDALKGGEGNDQLLGGADADNLQGGIE